MHIEFQNGAKGEYVNISKITISNEMERDILREAISEFINQEHEVKKTTYCEGELVVVTSDDCRLPKGTVCAVMYITEAGVTSYYIRNVESDYCCWAREDQIKGVI
jgi:hypothetical protein